MPFEGVAAYGASKSALQGMARGFARSFGHREITGNVAQPDSTHTDMNPADGPLVEQVHGEMAIRRHGTADEVASLVLYLAGAHARHYRRNAYNGRWARSLTACRKLGASDMRRRGKRLEFERDDHLLDLAPATETATS